MFSFELITVFTTMTIYNFKKVELCIIIPCYNNLSGLLNSIKSIYYDNDKYVILVVDDGSFDPISFQEIKINLPDVHNLILIANDTNIGITKTLNNALQYVYDNLNVTYIARLDCGDSCTPDRFIKQIQYLEQHLDTHLIGSWCYFKNNINGKGYKYVTPIEDKSITRSMHSRNVFIHPTVMWRVKEFDQIKYPDQFPFAEDYGLFYYMISKAKSAIIGEFLVTCEINNSGLSIHNRSIQLKSRIKVITIYSTNKLYYFMGVIKIKLLMLIPYKNILNIKNIIYKF